MMSVDMAGGCMQRRHQLDSPSFAEPRIAPLRLSARPRKSQDECEEERGDEEDVAQLPYQRSNGSACVIGRTASWRKNIQTRNAMTPSAIVPRHAFRKRQNREGNWVP